MSSADLKSWSFITTPLNSYGLASCNSQPVLVGGYSESVVTNKLYTLTSYRHEFSLLPPMPTPRALPTVTNIGQDNLVVTGGIINHDSLFISLDTVEVLINKQWSTLPALPVASHSMTSTLFNGNLYYVGGNKQGNTMHSCQVESLINCCSRDPDDEELLRLWSAPQTMPFKFSTIASYGQQLICTGGIESTDEYGCKSSKIFAISPATNDYVYVGDLPTGLSRSGAVVLQNQKLVVIGGISGNLSDKVFKASLQGKHP